MLDLSLTLANESWISIYRSRYANLEDLIPAGLLPTDPDYPITDPACSWADIKWLKSITHLPVIVKGMYTVCVNITGTMY